MTRLARVASFTALIALCLGLPAVASLDPARVFNPAAESFLPPLGTQPQPASIITAAIFHERFVLADRLVLPQPSAPTGTGKAVVAFAPASTNQVNFRPTAAPVELSTPQSTYEPQDSAVSSVDVTRVADASVTTAQPVHFGSYAPYAPALTGTGTVVTTPMHLGNVRFETAFGAMQHCGTADEGAACAQNLSAGTAFNVHAAGRNLNVRVESGVGELSNQSAGVFPYVPVDPDAQAGLTYPNVSNIFSQNVSAQLAIPVSPRMTVGLKFDRTHYQGNGALSDNSDFSGMRDTYLGNLTYQFKGSSALTLSARQYHYQDLVLPDLKSTQMRADLQYTVKF